MEGERRVGWRPNLQRGGKREEEDGRMTTMVKVTEWRLMMGVPQGERGERRQTIKKAFLCLSQP